MEQIDWLSRLLDIIPVSGTKSESSERRASEYELKSAVVLVFGRRQERSSARSTDRRPKSAKARSRGRLGGGVAASYGIWLPV
jgi:hypothetical protein